MRHYLLSICYPADSKALSPEALQNIMRDVAAVRKEMQTAGAWVPDLDAAILWARKTEVRPFMEQVN